MGSWPSESKDQKNNEKKYAPLSTENVNVSHRFLLYKYNVLYILLNYTYITLHYKRVYLYYQLYISSFQNKMITMINYNVNYSDTKLFNFIKEFI